MKSTMFHNAARYASCRLYERACPHQAITFAQGNFTYREDRCQRCDACRRVCLQDAIAFRGKEMALEAIMVELCRDRDYHENSDGGVTFSGGEPSVQQEALQELLRACEQEGLRTAVETIGDYSKDLLVRMMPPINLFLSDSRHPDNTILHTVAGADGALIKENLHYLLRIDLQEVIVRIPVIPVFNYEKNTLESALRYLKSIGVCKVNLLLYHTLGKVKYEKAGRPYTLSSKTLQKEDLVCYLECIRRLDMRASTDRQGRSSTKTHGTS